MTTSQTTRADLEAQAVILRRALLGKLRARQAVKSSKMRAILREEIDALAQEIRAIDAQARAAEVAELAAWLLAAAALFAFLALADELPICR